MRRFAIVLSLVPMFFLGAFWGIASSVGSEATAPKIVCDFNKDALSLGWSVVGKAKAYRGTPPEIAVFANGPDGPAVHLTAQGLGGVHTKVDAISQEWKRVEEISLWIWRPTTPDAASAPPVLEIQFIETDGRARFWQKIEVAHRGWKAYHLPLCWFRWSPGRVPQWENVKILCLMLRGEGDLWVDHLGARESDDGQGAVARPVRLLPLAFPSAAPEKLKTKETSHALLATDAAGLDAEALVSHLEKAIGLMQADMPFLKDSTAQGTLLVFSTPQEYRKFLPRLAAQMLAQVNHQPCGSGYTTHKIATSFFDPKQGSLRPVYVHEFVHSYIESAMSIPCVNEWFQEGVANYYQLRMHPQSGMPEMLKTALDNTAYQVPLKDLCSGKGIEMRSYWQAATLIDLLLRNPKYRDAFPKLVAAFQQSGSTNLEPHLKNVLNTDWETLQRDWIAHTKETYCQ